MNTIWMQYSNGKDYSYCTTYSKGMVWTDLSMNVLISREIKIVTQHSIHVKSSPPPISVKHDVDCALTLWDGNDDVTSRTKLLPESVFNPSQHAFRLPTDGSCWLTALSERAYESKYSVDYAWDIIMLWKSRCTYSWEWCLALKHTWMARNMMWIQVLWCRERSVKKLSL